MLNNARVIAVSPLFRRRVSTTSGAAPKPVVPQAASAAVLAWQKEIARESRTPLTLWLLSGGWIAFAVPIAIVGAGFLVLGPSLTGELLLGLTSPAIEKGRPFELALAWVIAVVGWGAVPTIVGAVAGYLVSARLGRYRSRTMEQIAGEDGFDGE